MLNWKIFYASLVISFTITSPGIIKAEEGVTKDIIWTLSEPFDPTVGGTSLKVYKLYINHGDLVMGFYVGSLKDCYQFVSDIARVTEGHRAGFSIRNIQANNASRYSIGLMMEPFCHIAQNEDAALYIYS